MNLCFVCMAQRPSCLTCRSRCVQTDSDSGLSRSSRAVASPMRPTIASLNKQKHPPASASYRRGLISGAVSVGKSTGRCIHRTPRLLLALEMTCKSNLTIRSHGDITMTIMTLLLLRSVKNDLIHVSYFFIIIMKDKVENKISAISQA